MTSEIATCTRCGITRTVRHRNHGTLCGNCAWIEHRRCERCGKPRGTRSQNPTLCGPCNRDQNHTIALQAGQWVRDGLIWRWQPDPQAAPEPIRCGTYRGYRKHRRAGEDACDECREAFRLWRREERAQQRQKEAA